MQKTARFVLTVFFLAANASLAARPYVKIQQILAADFPRVQVEVSVANAGPVLDLDKKNFELLENGRQIADFELQKATDSNEGKKIILLIDASRSLSENDFAAQIRAATDFVSSLQDRDSLAVISFNDSVDHLCGFSSNRVELVECLQKVKRAGKITRLFDAVSEAIATSAGQPGSRRSIVLFTDGKEEGSHKSYNDVLLQFKLSQVPLLTVATGHQQNLTEIASLSRLSGGEIYHTPVTSELRKMYLLINQLLEGSYFFTYQSLTAPDEKNRPLIQLEVRLKSEQMQDKDSFSVSLPFAPLAAAWQQTFLGDLRFLYFVLGLIVILLILLAILLMRRRTQIRLEVPPDYVHHLPPPDGGRVVSLPEKNDSQPGEPARQPQPLPAEYFSAYLVEKEGPRTGHKYHIRWDVVTLGHGDENSIVINDSRVSYRHARISREENNFVLYDLISENGTFLNGKKILRPRELQDFDEIQIGRTSLIFRRASQQ